MKFFFTVLVLLTALPASAARIETHVQCWADGDGRQGISACANGVSAPPDSPWPWGFAEAYGRAEAGAEFWPSWPDVMYRAETKASASAYATGYLSAWSDSTASLSAWLTTDGPVRDGWIDLDFYVETDWGSGGGGGWGSASVGPYSQPGKHPLTLGQPFLVALSATASASMSAGEFTETGAAYGYKEVQVYFTLYEADGVTWPFLYEVAGPGDTAIPEPVGTGTAGALVLLLLRLIRHT